MNWKMLGLALSLVLTTSLAACSGQPASQTSPGDAMNGDAMSPSPGGAMNGDAMSPSPGGAMSKDKDAQPGDAMSKDKPDVMQPSPGTAKP